MTSWTRFFGALLLSYATATNVVIIMLQLHSYVLIATIGALILIGAYGVAH